MEPTVDHPATPARPLAASMSQALRSLCESSPDASSSSAAAAAADPERDRLERAFEAFNARLRPVHHWTPDLRAERWALFALECRRHLEASAVPAKFAAVDLLRLDAWLPDGYRRTAAVLLGLRDRPELIAVGGARGRGKTAMACGLVRAFCRLGRGALYARVRDFFDAIDGVPWERKSAVKDRFARPDLLVLDEVQVRDAGKAWQDNDLTTLIDRRYGEGRATVLLSNLTPASLVQNLGDSVHRRLNEEGGILETDWPLLDTLRRQWEAAARG